MAMVLKTGQTYTFRGLAVGAPYAVIDQLNMNKNARVAHFVAEVWPEHMTAAERHQQPELLLEQRTYDVCNDEYSAAFNMVEMEASGGYALAYAWLMTQPEWAAWESDE